MKSVTIDGPMVLGAGYDLQVGNPCEDLTMSWGDGATPTADASNLIAEVGMDFSSKWNADVGYQWDPDETESSKAGF